MNDAAIDIECPAHASTMQASSVRAMAGASPHGKILSYLSVTGGDMRITSKGQVTIPQALRVKAGLLPNTEVEFDFVKGQVVIRPVLPSGDQAGWAMTALQNARGSADEPMFRGWNTARIMQFLRGED